MAELVRVLEKAMEKTITTFKGISRERVQSMHAM